RGHGGVRIAARRITMAALGPRSTMEMTMRVITGGAIGVAMLLGLSACTNPYDPAQRFVGGGLMGAATGAAIGAAAGGGHGAALGAAIGGATGAVTGLATTPAPGAYYQPPPGYYGRRQSATGDAGGYP